MEDVRELSAVIRALPAGAKPSRSDLVDLFRAMRRTRAQRSDIVAKYGVEVVESRTLGEVEVFNLCEQIYLAGLDTGDKSLVDRCLVTLMRKFPSSSRVKRLQGLHFEFNCESEKALAMYDAILAKNPGDILAIKRKICVHRDNGDVKAALQELHKAVAVFYGDFQLWLEMAEIYLSLCDFPAAAFCFEELILLQPNNHAFHTRLADTYYTIGGMENYIKARTHYIMSLNLQMARLNMRPLYGLIAVAKKIEDIAELVDEVTNSAVTVTKTAAAGGEDKDAVLSEQDKAVNKAILAESRDRLKSILDLAKGDADSANAVPVMEAAVDVL